MRKSWKRAKRVCRNPEELAFRVRQQLWNIRKKYLPFSTVSLEPSEKNCCFPLSNHFFVEDFQIDQIVGHLKKNYPDYCSDILSAADDILALRFNLLGYDGLLFGDNLNSLDWHLDPVNQSRVPVLWWKQSLQHLLHGKADPKVIWELNRHQFHVTLAIAYRLTSSDCYKRSFDALLESWIRENPPYHGSNWTSSLELAYRCISWMWAYRIFGLDSSWNLHGQFVSMLALHGEFIENNLSTYHSPNTHILGEALGLFYLGLLLPHMDSAERWASIGSELLLHYVDEHFLSDGGVMERSFWYHRYTVDIYLHFILLAEKSSYPLPDMVKDVLELSTEFLMYAMTPTRAFPMFGDDDGGHLLKLYGKKKGSCLQDLFCLAAVLFGRQDFKFAAGGFDPSVFWLLGLESETLFQEQVAVAPRTLGKNNHESGYSFLRSGWEKDDCYLAFDCGPLGWHNCGHAHADLLSFCVQDGEQPVIIDPGTFSYHGHLRNSFRGPASHSVLLVDGTYPALMSEEAFQWIRKAESEFLWCKQDTECTILCGQLNFGPDTGVTQRRSVIFFPPDVFVIYDECNGPRGHQLTWQFPLAGVPWFLEKNQVIWAGKKRYIIQWILETEHTATLENFYLSTTYGSKEESKVLRIRTALGGHTSFALLVNLSGKERNLTVTKREKDLWLVLSDHLQNEIKSCCLSNVQ